MHCILSVVELMLNHVLTHLMSPISILYLQCCVDLSSRVLKLQGSGEELPFMEPPLVSQCQHQDSNENL